MTRDSSPEISPERWVGLDDEIGRMLAQSNREFEAPRGEPEAYRRLSARLSQRDTPRRAFAWAAALTTAAATAAAAGLWLRAESSAVALVAPEQFVPARARPGAPALPREPQIVLPGRPAQPTADADQGTQHAPPTRPATPRAAAREAPVAPRVDPKPAPVAPGAVSHDPLLADLPEEDSPDCMQLARGGRSREAVTCFLELSERGGLGAERALYEVARLRLNVLADAPGALSALEEHRRRFRGGALAAEVDMFYLELLSRLGRHRDALAESSRMLASRSGQERAAELHMMRGGMYRRELADLAAAEREYAEVVRRGGASVSEALYFQALCLEQLGQRERAQALYTQYLAQPRRPREEEVRRRLAALSP